MDARFLKYIATGGAAAIVDVVGFRILSMSALPIGAAAAVSWFVAAIVNYSLTSKFVFIRAESGERLLHFLVGAGVGLSINVGVTVFCATTVGIDPLLSKVIGIGTAFLFNYLINLLWVFR